MTRQEILAVAKPILFNTDMVRAILDDRKTATRRVIKPQPCKGHGPVKFMRWFYQDWYTTLARFGDDVSAALCDRKPPYQPGDYLYVRETWCALPVTSGGHMRGHDVYYYKADGDLRPDAWKRNWRPSIHMPKEAARIFLRVTAVRAERLQDIDDAHIAAEGIRAWSKDGDLYKYAPADHEGDAPAWPWAECPRTLKEAMNRLWDSTIKLADLPLYGWDANPWVWVIEFERVTPEEDSRNDD